jgi:O-antigen ligase
MIDVSVLKIVGFGSLSLLVVAWLAVSFLAPGKTRSRLAWIAATCMYLALVCLFTNLFQEALRAESLLGMIAFGFLGAIFIGGVVASAVKTVGQFAGRGSASRS